MAIATHGPIRGTALAAWRLLRCHPFARGGFDPLSPPARPARPAKQDPKQSNRRAPTAFAHEPSTVAVTTGDGGLTCCPPAHSSSLFNDREVSALPEVHNPNLQSQRLRRRWRWGRYALHHGHDARRARRLFRLPVFLCQAQAGPAATRSNSISCRPNPHGVGAAGHFRPSVHFGARFACRSASTRQHRRKSPPPSRPSPQSRMRLFKIQFTNRGAQVQHWILKKYTDSQGKPLDLVQPQAVAHVQAAENLGLPLSLFTYDSSLTTQLNQALYQLTVTGAQPTATGLVVAPASISFHYTGNGLDAVKTFRFCPEARATSSASRSAGKSRPERRFARWSRGPQRLGDMEELAHPPVESLIPLRATAHAFFLRLVHRRQRRPRWPPPKSAAITQSTSRTSTPAVMDLYFASAFMPDVPERTTVVTLHNSRSQLPTDPSMIPTARRSPLTCLGDRMATLPVTLACACSPGSRQRTQTQAPSTPPAPMESPTAHASHRLSSTAGRRSSPSRCILPFASC